MWEYGALSDPPGCGSGRRAKCGGIERIPQFCRQCVLVVLTFVVFVVPTCAMGATLPVLVTELAERSRNVGLSIGNLYFTNTLGAAAGAIMAGHAFLSIGGLDLVVTMAAGLNLAVSAVAYAVCRRGV